MDDTGRDLALRQLMILAALRGLEKVVEGEIRNTFSYHELLLDNKVLGREYRRGQLEGKLALVRRQIEKRFGPIPEWAQERLSQQSSADLETLSLRFLDVDSLEDLLN